MTTNQMWAGEGSLGRAAARVSEARVDFDRLAAVLTDRIAGERSRWQGAGGQAFHTLHQSWTEKQRTIVAALTDFEHALTGTQSANTAIDEDVMGRQHLNLDRLQGITR